MNELTKVFNYNGNSMRTVIEDGEPWFVAKDACGILDLSNITETLKRLDEDELSETEVIDSIGRRQQTYIVSEPGLYNLILRSEKPEAKPFKRWITHEVLPQIRQTGGYIPISKEDDDSAIMAKALMIAQKTIHRKDEIIEKQHQFIETQAPAVDGYTRLINTEDLYTLEQTAKLISNGLEKPIGRNTLMRILRKKNVLTQKNEPMQHMRDRKYMEAKTNVFEDLDGNRFVRVTTYVTPKGLEYIRKQLIKLGEIA